MAYITKTSNQGQTWQSVSGNLPDVPVNDLVLDPSDPFNNWYIATDVGVFGILNEGMDWSPLNSGLPTVPVTDLTVHAPTRTVAAATFGRSMYRAEMPFYSGTKSPQIFENVRITPNPFLDVIRVSLSNLDAQNIQIELYNLNGKQIKTLFSGPLPTGAQHL